MSRGKLRFSNFYFKIDKNVLLFHNSHDNISIYFRKVVITVPDFDHVASIADRLREAMIIRKKKQVDLERETGINRSAISRYLSGEYEPKNKPIYELAKALDVSEQWLMGYNVPMERPKAQKNNDAISDIVVRLRTDDKFLLAVKKIYDFRPEKLESFLHLLD